MKQLLISLLIAVMVFGIGGSVTTAQTPEPTEEPTEGLTTEPTEEATDEPTAEPTEEATEEPTEETTEEATAEPTDEPTAEPTEEATEEPTEEATEEATEEPTEEATEEATAEPTEEATAETVQTSNELEGAAIGSFPLQPIGVNVFIFNPSETDSATVTTEYFKGSNSTANASIANEIIDPRSSVTYKLALGKNDPSVSSDFTQGSAKIQSTGQVVAIAFGVSGTPSRCAYEGVATGSDSVLFPAVFRIDNRDRFDLSGVQNIGPDTVTVRFTYTREDGTQVHQDTTTIPENTTKYFSTRDYVSNGFRGALLVESLGSQLLAGANQAKNLDETLCYSAFIPDDADTKQFIAAGRYIPSKGQWSQTLVMNVGTQPTDVRVKYLDQDTGNEIVGRTETLNPNQSKRWHSSQDTDISNALSNQPGGTWIGPIEVESIGTGGNPAQDIVAIELETLNTKAIYAYPGVKADAGGTEFLLAAAQRQPAANPVQFTSIQIANLDSSSDASVDITFYNLDGTQRDKITGLTIGEGGKANVNTRTFNTGPNGINPSKWTTNYVGPVVIESTGGEKISVAAISWLNGVPGAFSGFKLN